jgi:hypothetical protein
MDHCQSAAAARPKVTLVGIYYYYSGLVFGRGEERTDPFPNHVINLVRTSKRIIPPSYLDESLGSDPLAKGCVWDSPIYDARVEVGLFRPLSFLPCGLWIVWPPFLAFRFDNVSQGYVF